MQGLSRPRCQGQFRARAILNTSTTVWGLKQALLIKVVNAQDAKQLPCLRSLCHIAYSEKHTPAWVFVIEYARHPIQNLRLRTFTAQPIIVHRMSLPVSVYILMLTGVVFEPELEFNRIWLKGRKLLVEERLLLAHLTIGFSLLLDVLWSLSAKEEPRVSRSN